MFEWNLQQLYLKAAGWDLMVVAAVFRIIQSDDNQVIFSSIVMTLAYTAYLFQYFPKYLLWY